MTNADLAELARERAERYPPRTPAARMVDRSQMPGGGGRGPAPVTVLAPVRSQKASEYTLRETAGPTVSQSVHAHSGNRKTAGKRDERCSEDPVAPVRQFPSDSFPSDSFRSAAATTGNDVTLCALCFEPLHEALVKAGINTHPGCEPETQRRAS